MTRAPFLYAALLLIVMASALHAEPRVTAHHDPGPSDGWFARLVVTNLRGTWNRVETLDTSHGPVAVRYTTTPPSKVGDPASADHACVVALPDGVVAVPECMDVMEQETGEILLYEFVGG